MKILIVTPEYPPHAGGGILRYYHALAPALVRQGADVTVLVAAPTSADFADYEAEGVRVRCVPRALSDRHAARLAQFSAATEFRRWLAGALAACDHVADLAPDVIEATDFGFTFLPFVVRGDGPPVVAQLHGSIGQIAGREPARPVRLLDDTLSRLAELTTLPLAAEVQTYARGNAAEWSARLQRDVRVMPPPVDLPDVAGPIADTISDAVVVGRIQAWKGPDVLCAALAGRAGLRMSVRWIGRDTPTAADGGSFAADLARRFPQVWGSRITPTGQKSHCETLALMRAARVVIVPSTWDVFNLTAVEAMALGCVVVCSASAGASDLIQSGANGFVFEGGNPASLAEALAEADALSQARRDQIGAAARQTVRDALNPDRVAADRLVRYAALRLVPAGPRVVPDWLSAAFSAGTAQSGVDFLDQLAVRDLSKYLGRRLRTRLTSKAAAMSQARMRRT